MNDRWHISQTMPGYLGNEAPWCMVGTEAEAAVAARESVLHDYFDQCDCEDDRHPELDDTGDYYLNESDCQGIGLGGLHVWYARCEEPDRCELEQHRDYNCDESCSICAVERRLEDVTPAND